jgi:hypothetical protein
MRRLGIALLLLVAVLGAGLWFGPRLVDWDPWRPRLAELASARLGRSVSLEGAVELVLLPQPMVRAGRVSIGGLPGETTEEAAATGFAASARAMRLRLDLGALLAGRLEPREVALVGAELRLPWPPRYAGFSLRPPTWLTELDARIEDGRLLLGSMVLEGINARLSTGGPTQALRVEGGFHWRGRQLRFDATLGRPGWDGIVPMELTLAGPEASGIARGVLVPESGFEGRLEARGNDLNALLPAPPGQFSANGRLTASADLLAADDLTLDLAGAPARGAVALRIAPEPRLDVALVASRLDLDGWTAALRAAAAGGEARPRWPLSLDLSAEVASFRGQTLRRLRGAAFLEGERMTLSDVSLLLPGDTELELAGATAGGRLELAVRFRGEDLRSTLIALGLPLSGTDPARLKQGEGRLRLVLESSQSSVPELSAVVDGTRLSGAGVLRHGPRPALGLGLTVDRLELDPWLPALPGWQEAGQALSALDLNLRLAADQLSLRGTVLERASLDAALEQGKLTLRRLSGRLARAELVASGVAQFSPAPRFQDLSIELVGPEARDLAALLPGRWPDGRALATQPVALRLSAGGTPEALALRGALELGELRAEASGTLDAVQRRGNGTVTLRHPGAPRLLAEALGRLDGAWLGEGSFSLVATLAGNAQTVTAESFDLVAGMLRARGQVTLAEGARRPRLTGRIAAERLPLPLPRWRDAAPLGLDALLDAFDAELAVEAARAEAGNGAGSGGNSAGGGGPVLEKATATLLQQDGVLRLEGLRAQLAGGTLEGSLRIEAGDAASGGPPRLALNAGLKGAAVTAPLLGLPVDLAAAGGVEMTLDLTASGHSAQALAGTLAGEARVALRDGVVVGFDLTGAGGAAGLADLPAAESAVRGALVRGATAFERLELSARLAGGRATLSEVRLVGEGGLSASAEGSLDLARGALDLLIALRAPEGPDLGLRLTGSAEEPRRLPETAAWSRWRAERG